MVAPLGSTAQLAGKTAAKAAGSLGLCGIGVAVLSSAINKSAGAVNRVNDVRHEPEYVQTYVRNREILNIGLAIGSNFLVQTLLHKPVSRLLPRIPEGYVRMLLTAPGLYGCEYLSRMIAGKDKVEARLAKEKQQAQANGKNQDEPSAIKKNGTNITFAAFNAPQQGKAAKRLSTQA